MSDFERFSAKNAAMSRAWEMDSVEKKKEKKGHHSSEPVSGICDKCKKEAMVKSYRFRQTDRTDGAASFGTVVKHLCQECAPKDKRNENAPPPPTDRQVKNLLRGALRKLR